jgi:hypothetical protein
MPGAAPVGVVPVDARNMGGQKRGQLGDWPEAADLVEDHESRALGRRDAARRVMGELRLARGDREHFADGGKQANGPSPHGGAALVAVGPDAGKEVGAVAHALKERLKSARIAIPRIPPERPDIPVREVRAFHLSGQQTLGVCNRHLRVVCIHPGQKKAISRILDVCCGVIWTIRSGIGELKPGAIGISAGNLSQHGCSPVGCAHHTMRRARRTDASCAEILPPSRVSPYPWERPD